MVQAILQLVASSLQFNTEGTPTAWMNVIHYALKESAGQSLFYRQDKMEESPGSIGQGAR
jgi:hypothetical protein